MDVTKTGLFIAEKRKQKNLTQQELADILHLSNRTISKWECGNGLPDSSIMMELCKVLDVSVNELLSGEHISNEEYKIIADKNVIDLMNKPKQTYMQNLISILLNLFSEIILVVFFIVCIKANIINGTYLYDFINVPALLIIFGTISIILLITGLNKDYLLSFKLSLKFCDDISDEAIEKCIASIKIVMLSAFISGLTISITSLIGTLVNITPKNELTFYSTFGVCLLGILYGVMICIIMIPLLGRLNKIKYHKEKNDEK